MAYELTDYGLADPEEIHALFKAREMKLSDRHARMRQVSDVYGGRVELPLPEIAKVEEPAVPNLCQQGTDQLARRIASVMANLNWPALRPGIKDSEARADTRRQVHYGWWERNNYRRVTAQRARWYITYASAPVVVRPSNTMFEGGGPRWDVIHPFDMYPAPDRLGSCTPSDVIVKHKRTLKDLKDQYPAQMAPLKKGHNPQPDDEYICLEHITETYCCLVVIGKEDSQYMSNEGTEDQVKLFELENRAGLCWAVIPDRVSLDAPIGQFDSIMGMYAMQAAMMALQIHAARKAIWPTPWVVNPNGMAIPHIVQTPDSKTGEPGIITNGILDTQKMDPGYQGMQVIDTLEASQRQTASLPSELGGSGSQNVRTGRRGSQIMAASLDFTIAEAQDDLAISAAEEGMRAAAIDKGWYDKSKSFYVSWKGARGHVNYKPSEAWQEGAYCIARYPIAGTDLSDLVINAGQRIGQGTMSKRSFMEIDPLVDDVEAEEDRVRNEAVEMAFFTAMQNQAAQPDGPLQLPDFVRYIEKMHPDRVPPWALAFIELQEEKQAEQAQGAPAGAPETQPGLAMPGQGAEVPTVPGLGPGAEDMTALLGQLGVTDQATAMR